MYVTCNITLLCRQHTLLWISSSTSLCCPVISE